MTLVVVGITQKSFFHRYADNHYKTITHSQTGKHTSEKSAELLIL